MAISGFGRGSKGGTQPMGSSPPVASSSSSAGGGAALGNLTAFIDQGSEFEGKLSFKDTVRIDGSFSGEITSDNTLIVGETGEIHASIQSVCVVISGAVEGDISASDQVVLHKTANVMGDINAPSLVIEEGAQFNGNVKMGARPASASSSKSSSSKSSSAGSATSSEDEGSEAKSSS
ncbi:MAG: polymer-forming cytoskeletal protein [Deltaproteobacteria bacterium]|nr:polymer-forming cytoskeletal protein [Deltaproteobacteria bacterium]MBW2497936.1 polymer-forming cytoskeletal protein [Deltaproteobacteria bacterium]